MELSKKRGALQSIMAYAAAAVKEAEMIMNFNTEEYKNTRSCQLGYLLNDICTTTRSALPVAHRNRDSCLPQGLTQKF